MIKLITAGGTKMEDYIEPIKWGILIFPLVALLFTLPYAINQYRKFGAIPLLRVLIVYSFILYLICAYFLVILPLPDKDTVATLTTPTMQLQPLAFVDDFITQTSLQINDPSTYVKALTEPWFYQVVYNVLLVMPFGIYLRYYFKCSLVKTLLLSFLLSLFFELTQLSGLYGIYPRSYRLFDVDDLLINTFGGLIGFGLGGLFTKMLPTRDELDNYAYEKGKKVSIWRRLLSFGLDIFFLIILITSFMLISFPHYTLWCILLGFIIYFILFPLLTKGQTIGKKILKLRLVTKKEQKPKFYHYCGRYVLLYGVYLWVPFYLIYLLASLREIMNNFNSLIYTFGFGALAIFILVYYIVILVHLGQGKTLWYENITQTKNISTITFIKENNLDNELAQATDLSEETTEVHKTK